MLLDYKIMSVIRPEWTNLLGKFDDTNSLTSGLSTVSDSDGNIYVVGYSSAYSGIIGYDVSNNSSIETDFKMDISGNSDVYFAKYNSSGHCQWLNKISGTENEQGFGITIDTSNNIIITGIYGTTSVILFDVSGITQIPSSITLDISGSVFNAFICKYNLNGICQWATHIVPSDGFNMNAYGITSDSSNNIVITGRYYSTINFYDVSGTTSVPSAITLDNILNSECFIVKYNASGICQWASKIANNGVSEGYNIKTDSNSNYIVTGKYTVFSNPLSIYDSDNTTNFSLVNAGSNDCFVVKYDSDGFCQWATRISSTNVDIGENIAIDTSDNIIVIGEYFAAVNIYDSDTTTNFSLSNTGDRHGFIVKYNSNGICQWATKLTGASEFVFGIQTDINKNIFITGSYFTNTVLIYNSDGSQIFSLPNSGGSDVYLIKYNSAGICQWATRVAGSDSETGYGICLIDNNIVLVGDYASKDLSIYGADISGATSFTLPGFGNTGTFIIKYDSSGDPIWVTNISGSLGGTLTYSLKGLVVDASENTYHFLNTNTQTIRAYDGSGSSITLSEFVTVGNTTRAILVKYNKNGICQWITQIDSTISTNSGTSATDSEGNIILVGRYRGDTTFYNVSGNTAVASEYVLNDPGSEKTFVAKYNSNGICQWVTRFANREQINSIAMDTADNIYLAGTYGSSSPAELYDVDGISQTLSAFQLDSIGSVNGLLAKYNKNGISQWITRVGDTNNVNITFTNIDIDSDNNLCILGLYDSGSNTIETYDVSGNTAIVSSYYLTSGVENSYFIVKYNSNGLTQWITRHSGNDALSSVNITTDNSNNIFIIGYSTATSITFFDVNGTTDISSSFVLNKTSQTETYIAKYNNSGICQFVTKIATTDANDVYGYNIDVDSSNNIYVNGDYYTAEVQVYDASGTSTVLSEYFLNGAGYSYIVSYNNNGQARWITKLGNENGSFLAQLTVSQRNNIFVSGEFAQSSGIANIDGYDVSGNLETRITIDTGTGNSMYVVSTFKYLNTGQFVIDSDQTSFNYVLSKIEDQEKVTILGEFIDLDVGITSEYDLTCFKKDSVQDLTVTGFGGSLTINSAQTGFKYLIGILDPNDTSLRDNQNNIFKYVFFLKVSDLEGNLFDTFDGLNGNPEPLTLTVTLPTTFNGTFGIFRFGAGGGSRDLIVFSNITTNTFTFTLSSNSSYGGGGEPHIKSLIKPRKGEFYDLPNIDKSCYRLIEYNDLIVNCSTKSINYDDFDQYLYVGQDLVSKSKIDYLTSLTYFDKLYIKYKDSELELDFDTQDYKLKGSNISLMQENRAYELSMAGKTMKPKLTYPLLKSAKYTKIHVSMGNRFIDFEVFSDLKTDDRSNIKISKNNLDLTIMKGCLYSEDHCIDIHTLTNLQDVMSVIEITKHKKKSTLKRNSNKNRRSKVGNRLIK